MKKGYIKPELNTKAYAQFENVFTGCDNNPSTGGCVYGSDIPTNLPHHSHHDALAGS